MNWQKCPRCDGFGMIPNMADSCVYVLCPICNGSGFINAKTGQPLWAKISTGTMIDLENEKEKKDDKV